MTHKQWFNNVLHLHPVHEEGANKTYTPPLACFAHIHENSSFAISYLGLIASHSPSLYPRKVSLKAVAL